MQKYATGGDAPTMSTPRGTRRESSLSTSPCIMHHGAKHSPPGDRGPPDCLEGVPPVWFPGPPLIYHISAPCGAKHSPPGDRGSPDCLEGVPPVCIPGLPLIYHIPAPCGAKHSPPVRCPFGSPNCHLAILAKIMHKLILLCPMSFPMVPWIKEIQRVKIRTYV